MQILNFQRMSTEDGPGIRTTLFVKGCPLACKWCHNPESISFKKQIEWLAVRCIGCNICVKSCSSGALSRNEAGEVVIDREKCTLCMKCISECPTLALECKGEDKSVKEIFEELVKDRAYFGADGGVTLSGGEILAQSREAAELLQMLKDVGIKTAVDTCGLCKKSDFDAVLPYTDLFLYDIKLIDDEEHKRFTGQSNKIILENYKYLMEKIAGTDKKIWIRTPIIPGATDTDSNIKGIAEFIGGIPERWELCAFNNLCRDKYKRLYLDWDYAVTGLMTRERMNELVSIAHAAGAQAATWTGAVRLKETESQEG